jgi:hypothetical protein
MFEAIAVHLSVNLSVDLLAQPCECDIATFYSGAQ